MRKTKLALGLAGLCALGSAALAEPMPAVVRWLAALRIETIGPSAADPTPATRPDKGEKAKQASSRQQIGLIAAHRRLQGELPTGWGVPLGQVEGGKNQYMPNITKREFRGITFASRSGESEPFTHANVTGSVMYGTDGLAPGIQTVHNFASQPWLTDGYLRTGTPRPPKHGKLRLFNHSWIADPPRKPAAAVLRRVDYQIDEQGVVMCVGVDNGKDARVPHLLASGYNVIAVGAAEGDSSGGYTRVETKGRCKPELIAPKKLTSFATPMVTACAARLLEQGDTLEKQSEAGEVAAHATRPEVIKAVLLAGATKPEGWAPEKGKPLDSHLGAGMVNFNHALAIHAAGGSEPGRIRRSANWDYRPIEATRSRVYRFELNETLGPGSFLLTWHRQVAGMDRDGSYSFRTTKGFSSAARLANFDLKLIRLKRDGSRHVMAESASDIDNVEHIYQKQLKPGRYRLQVKRRADGYTGDWPYALAWRMERDA